MQNSALFFSRYQRHPDLLLKCLIRSSNTGHAPYCKATTHFSDNCAQSSFCDSKSTHAPHELENPFHLYVASSTKIVTPEPPVTTNTSAYPVKATTLESTAIKTRVSLPGNDNPTSSQPPNIKCDNVDRQLHIYCRLQGSLTWISIGGLTWLNRMVLADSMDSFASNGPLTHMLLVYTAGGGY